MRFNVLGTAEIRHAGIVVALGGSRQAAVLAALLLMANQTASMCYLTESVWDIPPAAPESNMRTYVSGLRRHLAVCGAESDRLVTRVGGYRLQVRPGEFDVERFAELADPRRSGEDAGAAADRLGRALALWRGVPLAGLSVGPRLAAYRTSLVDQRIAVVLRYAEAGRAARRHEEVIRQLRPMMESYPLREELHEQFIRTLAESGRRVEAVTTYRRVRQRLADELGVQPGPALQRLHQRIAT
jgi:DNA-binding SARP family transcriptional activator